MIIGCLGDIVFSTSPNKINTIKNMKWKSTVKFAEQDRHLNDPLLEFTGNDADEFSFSMNLSVHLGVNPIEQIAKLLSAKREGRVMPLVIGPKAYGTNKWVITSLQTELTQVDNRGNVISAEVSVTLKAYAG